MIRATLPDRGQDSWGAGYYGAPRGGRDHQGHDFACLPQTVIHAAAAGTVTKVGFAYGSGKGGHSDSDPFRYVEIEDAAGNRARYFYIRPWVDIGQRVALDEPVGLVQNLARRYPGITVHLHFEVRDQKGRVFDPITYLETARGEDGIQ